MMSLFVRLTVAVAVALLAFFLLGFVLKVFLIAAVVAALIVAGMVVVQRVRRYRRGPIASMTPPAGKPRCM